MVEEREVKKEGAVWFPFLMPRMMNTEAQRRRVICGHGCTDGQANLMQCNVPVLCTFDSSFADLYKCCGALHHVSQSSAE